MKKLLLIMGIVVAGIFVVSSCGTMSGASGFSTDINPRTHIKTDNMYDLIISENSIEYTIDISTTEGRLKLHRLNLNRAKKLVIDEAAIHYKCATIIRPKYTFLKAGNKILRITVFGFPANYKNAKDYDYVPESNRQKIEYVERRK